MVQGIPKDNMVSDSEKNLHDYVKMHIRRGTCKTHQFLERQPKNAYCLCGRARETEDLKHIHVGFAETFHESKHLTEERDTDFGRILFEGFGPLMNTEGSPYIRAHRNTDPRHLWDIFHKYWNVGIPKLIISVTGGAKFFSMKPSLVSSFKRGLIKAATTTDAWIITGGTDAGVMKYVGEAVEEHMISAVAHEQAVVAIGIASWGIVDNKEVLKVNKDLRNDHTAVYKKSALSSEDAYNTSSLDPNHSHFILVDDGREKEFGVEIDLRGAFEGFISRNIYIDNARTVCVPAVLIVVEGGPNTIGTAAAAVKNRTPVVVIQGSGRAADVIAETYRRAATLKPGESFLLESDDRRMISENLHLNQSQANQMERVIQDLAIMMKTENLDLISVYQMEDEAGKRYQLDQAILHSLLKAGHQPLITQLRLALAWECFDLAKTDIFTVDNRLKFKKVVNDAPNLMKEALKLNNPDFVELFLENGLDLSKFLNAKIMISLYREVLELKLPEQSVWLLNDLLDGNINVHSIESLVDDLMDGMHMPVHRGTKGYANPVRELFIWAVLLNRQQLAMVFWRKGTDHIGGALVASYLQKELAYYAGQRDEMDLVEEFENNSREFEAAAVGVLNECYRREKDFSHMLLSRELDLWGHETPLSLAETATLMDFMGHSCVQTKLNKTWMWPLAMHNSTWKILLGLLLPFMVFFLSYTTNKMNNENEVSPLGLRGGRRQDQGVKKIYTVRMFGICRGTRNEIGLFKALYLFYTTPFVKFCYHTIFYLIFLGLFSFCIMIELDYGSPGIAEILLWGWALTLLIEEMRQAYAAGSSLYSRFRGYTDNLWNRFDIFLNVMLVTSIILRLSVPEDGFVWARMFYALTLAMFYMRFMHVFFVHKKIGPKVIMIRGMLSDLAFFLLILVTVIFAYGVAQQALMYPNSVASWDVLWSVVAQPYWNIYGQIYLEYMHGELDGCTTNRTLYANNSDVMRCPNQSWLAILLNALYMLLTNILLINLLIAMFSYTFERVQSNSEKVWRFFRHGLIYEYFDKPTLPAPLIILSHAWRLLLLGKRWYRSESYQDTDFRRHCHKQENQTLTSFERVGMENHLLSKE